MELSTSTTLQGVFLALRHDFGTQNLASPALFTPPNPGGHGLFRFFQFPISTTYAPGSLLTSNPCRILVRGPNTQTGGGGNFSIPATFCHRLPQFISLAVAGKCYASQFRTLNRQARPPPVPRSSAAKRPPTPRNSSGSARLGLCLAPSCGSFCRFAGKRETTMADGHGSRLDSKPIVRRPT